MRLSDGRIIVPTECAEEAKHNPNLIPIHPDFRLIVLANRPGFPFLGHDFFAALGDVFSCHALDNADPVCVGVGVCVCVRAPYFWWCARVSQMVNVRTDQFSTHVDVTHPLARPCARIHSLTHADVTPLTRSLITGIRARRVAPLQKQKAYTRTQFSPTRMRPLTD